MSFFEQSVIHRKISSSTDVQACAPLGFACRELEHANSDNSCGSLCCYGWQLSFTSLLRTLAYLELTLLTCCQHVSVCAQQRLGTRFSTTVQLSHGHRTSPDASRILYATPSKLRNSVQCSSLIRTIRNLPCLRGSVITANNARIEIDSQHFGSAPPGPSTPLPKRATSQTSRLWRSMHRTQLCKREKGQSSGFPQVPWMIVMVSKIMHRFSASPASQRDVWHQSHNSFYTLLFFLYIGIGII